MSLTIEKIDDIFSVSPQIATEQATEIAALGFKTVINNRPDGEGGAEQPLSESIKNALASLGIEYRYIPINPQLGPTVEQVESLKSAITTLPQPILAFCRTGKRSANAYHIALG